MTPISRPPGSTGPDQAPAVATVRGPADVVAMIPYLLGFQPTESLVLVALEGPRKRFGPVLRLDLVDEPELVEHQATLVLQMATSNLLSRVLLAAFSVDPLRADPLVCELLSRLPDHHITVEDAFRVDGTRWWSYVCGDPLCCSPDGVEYDVSRTAVAAEAVLAGLAFEPDREALRAIVDPAPARERRRVAREVARQRRARTPTGQDAVRELGVRLTALAGDPSSAAPADLAWLSLAAQSELARDDAIALMDRSNAADHFEVWRRVMRCVDDDLLPDVGAVAAFAAWLSGRGVLASHAVDRVLEVDPAHGLGGAVAQLLARAVNPRGWASQAASLEEGAVPPRLAR